MKILSQIGILFGVCLLGEWLSSLLPFALPGSIVSMILVFFFLLTGILKERHIDKPADFLLTNMTFFFIPSGVRIIEHFDLLKSVWWQLLVISIVSLLACFVVSSWTVVLVSKLLNHWRNPTHD
ncbi:putative effector of murein hydrolase LrgA [Sphaerochaeta pleomorpha str. Grapes]|uniref:Putative effector of murein hydrolase LrgA n=1 Tax=Sphaerochaeta pleomorpha (strain ATCC BAA-1885 / DSM 22778 / Grapes) TaxID=158190 RepID=G8QU59_SPHPG|nr:CidA/LrgA family protein [Sphaerochaeta pleomorpha]AEV30306.1 putative effector of murein hydrolase LrgA [Sphaerochaeta pleomorpha str. Grapes]